jgi:hypothetical protein
MKERSSPATQYAEYETWSAFFFGEPSGLSSYLVHRQLRAWLQDREDFLRIVFPLRKIFSLAITQKLYQKREEATRQQPSELSGEILSLAKYRVKAKTCLL